MSNTNNNNNKLIHALCLDYYHIYAVCNNPNCSDYIHKYDSNSILINRLENRLSNCPAENNTEICIRIDDTTIRGKLNLYLNRSMTISRRGFEKQRLNYNKEINSAIKEKYLLARKLKKKIEIKNGKCLVYFN